MGSVYPKRRANGTRSFVAQITLPSKERIAQSFSTRSEALAWLAEMESQIEAKNTATTASSTAGCKSVANRLQTSISAAESDLAADIGNPLDATIANAQSSHQVNPFRQSSTTPGKRNGNTMPPQADPVSTDTLAQVIDRYVLEIMPLKRSTKAPLQQLGYWRARLGHLPINHVTPVMIARAKSELLTEVTVGQKLRKPSTINRYLAILCHVYTIAMKEWFLVMDNPAQRVRKCKESQGRTYFLSREEHVRLLKALKLETPIIQTVVKLALYTGMRHGEIIGLKWRNVDLSRAQVRLDMTKNGRPRGVPLVGTALETMIDRAASHQGEPEALLFPSTVNASVPFDTRRGWERLKKQINMPHLHFHDLRHTTASYMAMSGSTPQEIAEVLGHRTLQMVKRYSHLADGHSRGALDRMAKEFCVEMEATDVETAEEPEVSREASKVSKDASKVSKGE